MFNNDYYLHCKKKVKETFKFFLDAIFPIECLGCGKEGRWLCSDCLTTMPLNLDSHCLECKTQTNFGEFCQNCRGKYNLIGVLIASDYNNELVKKAIKTLKFRFVPEIGQELGGLLILFLERQLAQIRSAYWPNSFLTNKNFAPQVLADVKNTLMMPVPLYPRRERWRGFNQSEILARTVAECFKAPVDVKNLRRVRPTREQASLGKEERALNAVDCFAWQGESLTGKNVILVDDVVTTGATLESCAQVLKEAGAGEVWGLVVAKG